MRPAAPSKLTLEQAYEAAYLWLFHIDQPPKDVKERPPEMVELYSDDLVSWVRAGVEVAQKAILALLPVDDERKKVIFSAAGYSPGAISIGESQGVALFTLRADGSAQPETGHAIMMMPDETPPAPFAAQLIEDQSDEDLTMTPTTWGTTKFDSNVWVDCPECGTNQHVSLKSCRVCGTKLVAEQARPVADAHEYRCRDCGSHDIEVLKAQSTPAKRGEAEAGVADHDKYDSRR